MTKEEQWIKGSIENYIFAYTGKRAKISDADAQHFTASVMSYLNLCTPSLPANLDEAAEKYTNDSLNNLGAILRVNVSNAFKAGAEWMAGLFVLVGGEPTGWFRANDGSEYATGLDLGEPIKLPVDFYVRKK